MKQKTISLAFTTPEGEPYTKEVTFAYCYATEIAYRNFTNENVEEIFGTDKETVNLQKVLYLVLSAIMAYYHDPDSAPVTDEELLYNAEPETLPAAFTTVCELRREWYKVPAADADQGRTKRRKREKNA